MRWNKVLGVGTLAGLFLTGATATARLDAAPTAGQSLERTLQVSGATVEREWAFARAWLYDAIEGIGTGPAS